MKIYDELKWRGLIKDEAGEDLKEKLSYPENILNSNIVQLVQNENVEKTQVMVYYESGKALVFDYATGEIIYENNIENNISLFSYIANSFSNIWSDYEEKQIEYKNNKEIIEKLEETPIEKVIEEMNISSNMDSNDSIDTNNNNQTSNNSSLNNKYITVYEPTTNSYEVYSEKEILTGEGEEPVSENKKIQLNGLQNFYSYEVAKETNEANGIIIISVTIVVILLALMVLRRYMYLKRKKEKKNRKVQKHKE